MRLEQDKCANSALCYSWSKVERPDLARQRLQQAASVIELIGHEDAKPPFPSMRPLWDNLEQVTNTKGGLHSAALIDSNIEEMDQLGFSTLGEKSPVQTFAQPMSAVDEVDSEGFTSQDAGHITHEQYHEVK